MSKLEEIESAITRLGPSEFARLREWIDEVDARRWDEQLESDASQGRLDKWAHDALDGHGNGRCTPL